MRPNLNKLYLAQQDGICSTDILVLRCNNPKLQKFYAYCLRTKSFNDEIVKTVTGQQLPRTKWSLIENIKIPVPPIADQLKIVAEIEILEQTIQKAQTVIDQAPERKKAIVQQFL